ncbi:hypothetical protein [Halomonas sp. AOP25-F1-15]|uniref:hypothetical protein n=1 Tax=Halomonas sp. AOP25-F1-15 TaxID=3457709 RepID=UPI00403365D0
MNTIARGIDALNEWFGRLMAPLFAVITLIEASKTTTMVMLVVGRHCLYRSIFHRRRLGWRSLAFTARQSLCGSNHIGLCADSPITSNYIIAAGNGL